MWYLFFFAFGMVVMAVILNNIHSTKTKKLVASYENQLKLAAQNAIKKL